MKTKWLSVVCYLPLICERIAAIYGISPDEVAETTARSVRKIFGDAFF